MTAPARTVTVRLPAPHPGQRRVSASTARYRVVMCGRRWGKTVHGEAELAKVALQGLPVAWFAPTYKYALEVWADLLRRLRPVIARSNATERRIELHGGGTIDVWTLDAPDAGRGRKYALAVIDEAGLVPDLLAHWQESIRPTLTDLRGRALFLGTPKGRRHGFVTLFARGEAGDDDWASFRASTRENPHIPADEIDAAQRELPPAVFAQEYEGTPSDDGTHPIGLDIVARQVKPASERPVVVWGLDLARAVDWTVLVGLDDYGVTARVERWQLPWQESKARIRRTVGDVPVLADATGVGDGIVADMQAMGVPVSGYVFTATSKLQLMQRLITAFHAGLATIPLEAAWLRAEYESLEHTHTATGTRYGAPAGLHDDGVMAHGLAILAWDRVCGAPPADPVPAWAGRSTERDTRRVDVVMGVADDADGAYTGGFAAQLPAGW